MNKEKQSKLPAEFKKYFWDCNFNDLYLEQYKKFITERVLAYGNVKAVRWLFLHLSKEEIKDIALKSRRLDKRTVNFWKVYFE